MWLDDGPPHILVPFLPIPKVIRHLNPVCVIPYFPFCVPSFTKGVLKGTPWNIQKVFVDTDVYLILVVFLTP